ncbi:pentapeptide repeat-containing protein [Crocosphaera sp.]|uniref:pentapeptide repeat-containing protein n=1 Tax=Crocosphaera sp. TaxID=2729996 RepID=UPI00261A1A32|nr:pentapeptide repeat-containing protein [Crocosphaera sp.]MDJ0579375.1 pentapeptide repeat-containing protein [Crocosphaera sp.]
MNNHIEREKKLYEKYQEIWKKEIKFAKKSVYDWYDDFNEGFKKIIEFRAKQFKCFVENDKKVLEITEEQNYQLNESDESQEYRKQAEEYFYRIEKLAYEELEKDNSPPSKADNYLKRQEKLYCLLKAEKQLEKNVIKKIERWWEEQPFEKNLEFLANFFRNAALIDVLERIGEFSIIIGLLFWFTGCEERKQQKHYQAWNIINTAQTEKNPGNTNGQEFKTAGAGRRNAIQDLYQDEVSLAYLDVAGVDLSKIKLGEHKKWWFTIKADLKYANLSSTNLLQANLNGADLKYANLSQTELVEIANKDKQVILDNADMSWADISETDLTGIKLSNVILTNANLSRAILVKTELNNVDMMGADLTKADLGKSKLSQVNLTNANLSGADLRGVDLSEANISGALYTTPNTDQDTCKKLGLVTTKEVKTKENETKVQEIVIHPCQTELPENVKRDETIMNKMTRIQTAEDLNRVHLGN